MNFNDFLIKSFAQSPDKINDFLDRQIEVRELFKEQGREISWLLDICYMLFLIKNCNNGYHFKLKRTFLEEAFNFCQENSGLEYESEQLADFLK